MTSYINAENIMKYSMYCTHFRTEMIHPNEEINEIGVTKKRVGYNGDTKESKKYGCVCMCCHADDCLSISFVIFLRNNYNFEIPAVANALSKRYREIR